MKIVSEIKTILNNFKLNKRIKKCKYVHLMFNDKFNKPFVDFLNEKFDSKEHIILCKRSFKEFPFPVGPNVVEVTSFKKLKFDCVNKVFCHSLFDPEVVEYLYAHKNILKNKSYWVVWGGDLYSAPRDEKNDYVRKNFRGYLLFAENDKVVLENKYEQISSPRYFPIEYPLNLDISKIKPVKSDFVKIQINNSCDETTLEMLDILSKFKDENIQIVTILSYGQLAFKDKIKAKGKEIFGDKFKFFEDFLTPKQYAEHIASIDIFIANQNRQQATANIDMCLFFNKKVFIKSDVSTYDMYTDLGYKIFDTYSIKDMTYKQFVGMPKNENAKKAAYYTSLEYRQKLWKGVLDD